MQKLSLPIRHRSTSPVVVVVIVVVVAAVVFVVIVFVVVGGGVHVKYVFNFFVERFWGFSLK